MAKQTFTTGQVLTAAQMTSLQQTAMLGGAASAKTASYTLVAADAGTAITMSNASATTITVNTALFAAGDTVQITNLGAGVCTITAGTATVNTSASLALAQYESGTLDFTSTSAAIFIKGSSAGGAVASGLTLVKTQTIGSAVTSVTVTDAFSSTYDNYLITINGGVASNSSSYLNLTLGSTTTGYSYSGIVMQYSSNTVTGSSQNAGASMFGGYFSTNALSTEMVLQSPNLSKRTIFSTKTAAAEAANYIGNYIGFLDNNTSYTAFTFTVASGNVTGGTIRVYGFQNS
jgi:hypothetical protein